MTNQEISQVQSFPFSAVLGHDEVKLALILNAIDPKIGGCLLRGEKGSAKSTLARSLAALLSETAPFVELPLGATEDRLVGTLDIGAVLTTGSPRFLPGILAQVDGGVLYVDEVNLLPSHLVDVLLDVATSGINRVEREAISKVHSSRFILIGSMNPEEGELRPQLIDRFGLCVDISTTKDPIARAEAVRRRLYFDSDPDGFARKWSTQEMELSKRLETTTPAPIPDEIFELVANLCSSVGAEGLRADLVICRAAAALAGWHKKQFVTTEQVRQVAGLALAHRRRKGPFDEPGIDQDEIDAALDDAVANTKRSPQGLESSPDRPPQDASDKNAEYVDAAPQQSDTSQSIEGQSDQSDLTDKTEQSDTSGPTPPSPPSPPVEQIDPPNALSLDAERLGANVPGLTRSQPMASQSPGRSVPKAIGQPASNDKFGRQIGSAIPKGAISSLAIGASIRASVTRRMNSGNDAATMARTSHGMEELHTNVALLTKEDLREPVYEQKLSFLVIFVVDTSASMTSFNRLEAAKGATANLLLDAYQKRDRVCLITFHGQSAQVALRPTSSVEVARNRLSALGTGGQTPLAAGIETATQIAKERLATSEPLIVLLTDGRATCASGGKDPLQATFDAADVALRMQIPSLVLDFEDGQTKLEIAREIASRMGARYLHLPEMSTSVITSAVRDSLPK